MADSAIAQPLTLKCGLKLPNRLAKSAMAEVMSGSNGLPSELHDRAYDEWGKANWGMLVTGNVQVDRRYLSTPFDNTLSPELGNELKASWKSWAHSSTQHGTPIVMQLSHPGRQSPLGAGKRSIFAKNLAPSALDLDMGPGYIARWSTKLIFGTPQEMTQADIDAVVSQFISASRLAADTGFSGVQLHGAHGYLLSQFLSYDHNIRTDSYGKTAAGRAKIVVDIVRGIRDVVAEKFCVGIKLNSVDHQSPEKLNDCIEQIRLIVDAGVDFVEISGGTYGDPKVSTLFGF